MNFWPFTQVHTSSFDINKTLQARETLGSDNYHALGETSISVTVHTDCRFSNFSFFGFLLFLGLGPNLLEGSGREREEDRVRERESEEEKEREITKGVKGGSERGESEEEGQEWSLLVPWGLRDKHTQTQAFPFFFATPHTRKTLTRCTCTTRTLLGTFARAERGGREDLVWT